MSALTPCRSLSRHPQDVDRAAAGHHGPSLTSAVESRAGPWCPSLHPSRRSVKARTQRARRYHALSETPRFAASVECRLSWMARSLELACSGVQWRSALVIRGGSSRGSGPTHFAWVVCVQPGRAPNVVACRVHTAAERTRTGHNGALTHNASLSDVKRTSVLCPGTSDNAALCCPARPQLSFPVQCRTRGACGVPRALWPHLHLRVSLGRHRARTAHAGGQGFQGSLSRCASPGPFSSWGAVAGAQEQRGRGG